MTTRKVEVQSWVCDGCSKETLTMTHDGPPIPWYQGNVLWHHGGGGCGGDWDACSKKCIRNAVIFAAETSDNDRMGEQA